MIDSSNILENVKTWGNDDLKIGALKIFSSDMDKMQIIQTIRDEDKRLNVALQNFRYDAFKAKIIETIKDDEKKIQLLEEIETESAKVEIIKSITDDGKKIELLSGMRAESSKVEIIKSIKNDEKKIKLLEEIEAESAKVEIIKSIKNDDKKIQCLEKIKVLFLKIDIIISIKDDDKKIQILEEIEAESVKVEIIKSIKDDSKKIKLLKDIKADSYKVDIIETIKDEEERISQLNEVDYDSYKRIIIETIDDSEKRLQIALKELKEDIFKIFFINQIKDFDKRLKVALKELKKDRDKKNYITEIEDPIKRIEVAVKELKEEFYIKQIIEDMEDSQILNILDSLSFEAQKISVVTIRDTKTKMKLLDRFKGNDWLYIASTLPIKNKIELLDGIDENMKMGLVSSIEDVELKLQLINKLEKKEEIKQILKRLYQTNNDVIQTIDLRILDKRYMETLGDARINLISCFPKVQQQILTLTEKQYELFEKCLNNYLDKNETDEWTVVVQSILNNLKSGQYSELINNIENFDEVDIGKLTVILQYSNDFGLRNIEDIKNYEEIKRQKCDEMINGNGDIAEKRNAIFLKILGQDLQYTKTIIEKYGEDIESIEDGEEKNYVLLLKEIMDLTDEDLLKQIYYKCEDVEIVDKADKERKLKSAYGKMFNDGLYKVNNKDILEEDKTPNELKNLGVKVYNAGTDFKMIITSVAAYVHNSPNDFKKDWNRPAIASQHFCSSYIRSDMMGIPPMPHLCYGFCEMKEDALMLSGNVDIWSSSTGFVSTAGSEKYYSPDEQINRTTRKYNEMDFRRIQGGEKKQPDYIVAFQRNGKIDNIDKIKKAIEDWGQELPIVIVDVDECLRQQRQQVDDLIQQYNESKSPEKAIEILQKVRNNRMTDERFCKDIQSELIKVENELGVKLLTERETMQHTKCKIGKNELKENNEGVTPQERKESIGAMRGLLTKVRQIAENKREEEIEQ